MADSTNSLWSIGGVKLSKNQKRVNVGIIRTGADGNKEYGTISIDISKGTSVCKVKVREKDVVIGIERKDISNNANDLNV